MSATPKELLFQDQIAVHHPQGLCAAETLQTIQVNIGLKCNLTCRHCHVNSSPQRKEEMDWPTMQRVLGIADELNIQTIDITGGAPEMNPHFERFITEIYEQGLSNIVRTNLTILLEPGYLHLIELYKKLHVHLVASLPCYTQENVDQQRGDGVSIPLPLGERLQSRQGNGHAFALKLAQEFWHDGFVRLGQGNLERGGDVRGVFPLNSVRRAWGGAVAPVFPLSRFFVNARQQPGVVAAAR